MARPVVRRETQTRTRMNRYSEAGLDCFQLLDVLQLLEGKRKWLCYAMLCMLCDVCYAMFYSSDWKTRVALVWRDDRYVISGASHSQPWNPESRRLHGDGRQGAKVKLFWKTKRNFNSIARNHHFISHNVGGQAGWEVRRSSGRLPFGQKKDIFLFSFFILGPRDANVYAHYACLLCERENMVRGKLSSTGQCMCLCMCQCLSNLSVKCSNETRIRTYLGSYG